ncbi:MAG: hypothetical protein RLZZ628_1875 [Bacteroidota bacterium]|jgi:hypothetical protein
MVIIVGKQGQLCNRIFHASAFLANAIEYDYPCLGYLVMEPVKMRQYLTDFPDGQVIMVSKSALRASFCLDVAEETQCAGFPLHASTKNLFWIKEIAHPATLEFAINSLYIDKKMSEAGKYVENKGLPVTILEVRSLGKFKYNPLAAPIAVEAGGKFAVKGSGGVTEVLNDAGFEFSCRDGQGKIHWFQVGDKSNLAIEVQK